MSRIPRYAVAPHPIPAATPCLGTPRAFARALTPVSGIQFQLVQARGAVLWVDPEFTAAVDVTGMIVAKLDGTARGGAVFGIKDALGLPVRYIGTGESLELLELFQPELFVEAIVGAVDGAVPRA